MTSGAADANERSAAAAARQGGSGEHSGHAGHDGPSDRSTRSGGITATVRTTDGASVSAAVLTVTNMAGHQVAHVRADAGGALRTDPLSAGSYIAIVTAAGFGPVARTAMVTGSGASLGVLELQRASGLELPRPGVWTIDPAHSAITITARHLGFASVRGRFTDFGGRIEVGQPVERSSVLATIASASIDTGNKMRDDHLRSADFLAVDRHPAIEYRGSGLEAAGQQRWTLRGELTLNAVRKPVPLALEYLGGGPDAWGGVRAGFHATAELRRQDFAINYNQVLQAGIAAVGATLQVELDIEAVFGDSLPEV